MSSISWLRADDSTSYMNIAEGSVGFRLLVPKPFVEEFGTEIRSENYGGKGLIMYKGLWYDMYGLLAKFNKDFLNKSAYTYKECQGVSEMWGMRYDNETMQNREIGIAISKDIQDVIFLRYPLKLVSLSYEGTKYEKCAGFSVQDVEGGKKQTHWNDDKKSGARLKVCKQLWEVRAEYERRLEAGLPPISKFEVRPGMAHTDLMTQVSTILKSGRE